MNPITKRLAEAVWAQEWPEGAVFGEANGLPTPSSWLTHAMEWSWNSTQKVVRALTVEAAVPVSLEQAHRTLTQLEEWTVRNRSMLTWPATPLGFARALVHSVSVGDEAVAAVIGCYPAYCENVLEQARALDPKIPDFTRVFGLNGYRKAAPKTPAEQPPEAAEVTAAPSEPAVAAPEATPAPVAPDLAPAVAQEPVEAPLVPEAPAEAPAQRAFVPASRRQERAASPPVPPSPWLMGWVEKLGEFTQPVLAMQFLDQKVKESVHAHRGTGWQWFDQVFLEALFSLPEKEMGVLLEHWPSHTKFRPSMVDSTGKLSEWFDQRRLWGLWRDAGPERQVLLATGGMAKLVDGGAIYPEDMPDFFGRITMYAKNNPRSFRQRFQLWESLGGKLDEPVPSSPLLESQNVTTVREWILAQDNAEWKNVLETLSPDAPVVRSRFGRGPGR